MADDNKEKQEGNEELPTNKSSKTMLIVILVVLFLVLGGGGFAAYQILFAKTTEPVNEQENVKETVQNLDKIVGFMYPMDAFLVNIEDDGESRFLKATLTLELENEDLKKEMETRIAQIRDTLLLLLSSKSFSDIRYLDGKYILREEIMDQLNHILLTGKLKNVYFSEFVVQ